MNFGRIGENSIAKETREATRRRTCAFAHGQRHDAGGDMRCLMGGVHAALDAHGLSHFEPDHSGDLGARIPKSCQWRFFVGPDNFHSFRLGVITALGTWRRVLLGCPPAGPLFPGAHPVVVMAGFPVAVKPSGLARACIPPRAMTRKEIGTTAVPCTFRPGPGASRPGSRNRVPIW